MLVPTLYRILLKEVKRQNLPFTNKYYITNKAKEIIYINKDLKGDELTSAIDSLIFHIKYLSIKNK